MLASGDERRVARRSARLARPHVRVGVAPTEPEARRHVAASFFARLAARRSPWDTGTLGYWDPCSPVSRNTGILGPRESDSRDSQTVRNLKDLRSSESCPVSRDTGTPASRDTGTHHPWDTGTLTATSDLNAALSRWPGCTCPLASACRSVHAGLQDPPYTRSRGVLVRETWRTPSDPDSRHKKSDLVRVAFFAPRSEDRSKRALTARLDLTLPT